MMHIRSKGMRHHVKKSILSMLLVLCMLVNATPDVLRAEQLPSDGGGTNPPVESTDTDQNGGADTGDKNENKIPEAKTMEHVHNSVGWTCTQVCQIAEHTHTVEAGCYKKRATLNCAYHEHETSCYDGNGALKCGKKSMTAHTHTLGECYTLTCSETEHQHDDTCNGYTCGTEEHTHDDTCKTLTCGTEEHTHGDACNGLVCLEEVHKHEENCYHHTCNEDHEHTAKCYEYTCGNADHAHTDECKQLDCNKKEHEHTEACNGITCTTAEHTHSEACKSLTCGIEEHTHEEACKACTAQEHTHTQADCYELTCKLDESDGHTHSIDCEYELICTEKAHTHDDVSCDKKWICDTDYVLLTVEYYIAVDGQMVRSDTTYQALLSKNDVFHAPVKDLSGKKYKVKEAKLYTEGKENDPQSIDVKEAEGGYYVTGTITKNTKIIVTYVYEDDLAPYRVDYLGYGAAGEQESLIYSYKGWWGKDLTLNPTQGSDIDTQTISVSINTLLQNLYDILGDKTLGESGADFIEKLLRKVNDKYYKANGEDRDTEKLYHDITPLLESIAGKDRDINSLTRLEIKQDIANKMVKVYGFDAGRQGDWHNATLTVTADELAVRNLYYVEQLPQSAVFVTGVENADVIGIPEKPFDAAADADGIKLDYNISLGTNYITCKPTLDISNYTKNIYAYQQSYIFVGWVTDVNGVKGPITDYDPEKYKGTKYKDMVIYTAPGSGIADPRPGAVTPTINVQKKPLSDALQTMPDAGVTYYGVWQPFGTPYTVQLWFESEQGDNTYVESHSFDIHRFSTIGKEVSFNDFDKERAKEASIIDAANEKGNATFPIQFKDTDSDTVDEYHSYTDYQNSPFFGFDFLECEVCDDNPADCGTKKECTCGFQRNKNADGTEETTQRACNYQLVTLNDNGSSVLNLYYNRETWKITITPSVQLWTAETLWRASDLVPYTYWTGGKEKTEIVKELEEAKKDETAKITIKGKYGTAVKEEDKNAIGWDKIGSGWQDKIKEEEVTLKAGTEIVLENGSKAFGSPVYVYPQDTVTYTDKVTQKPEPQDWDLPFHCLSTIEEEMFTNRTGVTYEKDSGEEGYKWIQKEVSMWESNCFDGESSYDLTTGKRTYGTHELKVYPYYHADSDKVGTTKHTYEINYYLQALPHQVDSGYKYKTAKEEISFVQGNGARSTSPEGGLNYHAATPRGFIPLMWRTSPQGFVEKRGYFQGLGTVSARERYGYPQAVSNGGHNTLEEQIALKEFAMNYHKHNASFNKYNVDFLGGNTSYQSDWLLQYTYSQRMGNGTPVGRMDPGGYWITDWIRVGAPGAESQVCMDGSLTGENGLYALIDQANHGNLEARALLDQLESSFSIGRLFPTGNEVIYYHNTNPNAIRYAGGGGSFPTPFVLDNCENAVAFARNQYTITYNTCFVDKGGELLRDENGIVMSKLYTTKYTVDENGNVISDKGDMVYFDQPLGYNPTTGAPAEIANFDDYYLNYYDAYFERNANKAPTAKDAFTFVGCGEENETSLGGYGSWYLDPDGSKEFTENELPNMPAGNLDVYFRYQIDPVTIYFSDAVTGKNEASQTVKFDGETKTIEHVIHQQELVPGTAAEPFPYPVDADLQFVGWFFDKEGTRPYSFEVEIYKDTVVYAVWKPKVPTQYEVRHILKKLDGTEIDLVEPEWLDSYVGDTVDAKALGTDWYQQGAAYYKEGMHFEVADYSQTKVLVEDKDQNILTFYYTYTGLMYTIEYRDINNPDTHIIPSVTYPTKLSQVTVGMTEIPGWDYWGYSVRETMLDPDGKKVPDQRHVTVQVTPRGVVVTFWYERTPIDGMITAHKLLDDVLADGTWFSFELVDANGNVAATMKSVDGIVEISSLKGLNLKEAGTYRYTLREVDEKQHFVYDSAKYEVVIEVEQPDIAQPLESTITYYRDGKRLDTVPVFKNYRKPAEVRLTADKYLDGKLMAGSGFGFLLQGGEGLLECGYHVHDGSCYEWKATCGYEENKPQTADEGDTPDESHEHTDDCYEKVLSCGKEEAADHKKHSQSCYSARTTLIEERQAVNGEIAFKPLTFDKVGTYVYTVHERNDGGTAYEYDSAVYRVAIDVFINERNELDTKVTITCDGKAVDKMKFENHTVKKPEDSKAPTLTISAKKLLDGKAPKGKRFSFTLTDADGKKKTAKAVKGKITFPEISLKAAGTYVYTLKEKNEGESGITYDKAVYKITVVVTEDAAGNLVMDDSVVTRNGKSYKGDIKFKNYTKAKSGKENEDGSGTEKSTEKSSEKTSETESESQTEAPKTGDNTSGTPYLMMQLGALMLLLLLTADKKRRRKIGRDA